MSVIPGVGNIQSQVKSLNIIIGVFAAITVGAGVYTLYKNNLWKPSVQVDTVDINSGYADLVVNGKKRRLYTNSVMAAGGDWGVRFNGSGERINRIELTKKGLVYDVLYKI